MVVSVLEDRLQAWLRRRLRWGLRLLLLARLLGLFVRAPTEWWSGDWALL